MGRGGMAAARRTGTGQPAEAAQERQAQRGALCSPVGQVTSPPPYLEPPCWSEPCCPPRQGWGNNCVISPPSLGAEPSLPEVTQGGNHRAGPPPSEGKISWPADLPQQPTDPKSGVCAHAFRGTGCRGAEGKAGGIGCHSGRYLQQLPSPPASSVGLTHLDEGVCDKH